jgi:uncharacterized repeat protein (TIGR03803 family)
VTTLALVRLTFSTSVVAALLAACGGSQPPIGAPGAMPQRRAIVPDVARLDRRFENLYSFKNNPDGAYPNAGLILRFGNLFGTTAEGGTSYLGTVFEATPSGRESVLHSFTGTPDGQFPDAELITADGGLYSTTEAGGQHDDGTVFVISGNDEERVVYSFAGSPDGSNPGAGLVEVHGEFYGTTMNGGAYGDGTVFEVSRSGVEHVIYSFGGTSDDGTSPSATLTWWDGMLYGTTQAGGAYGDGTVFAATTSGAESVLYSFGSGSGADGIDPYLSKATPFRGSLYGTTAYGGAYGQGTVFVVSPSGGGRVLYALGEQKDDGNYPAAGVITFQGALYGTAYGKGAYGHGVIFRVSASGQERVLYSFRGGTEGAASLGGLLAAGDAFYGTASLGGESGVGTIFTLVR